MADSGPMCRCAPQQGPRSSHRGWRAVRHALLVTAARTSFRVVHVSIQATHVHAIVEADDRLSLARGMQGFQIACARRFNRLRGTRGRIFADRYHAVPLRAPLQVHRALAYVLNNWRRHREDFANGRMLAAHLDEYSSAVSFREWTIEFATHPTHVPLPVSSPRSWLLREGWKRFGAIDPHECPGPLW